MKKITQFFHPDKPHPTHLLLAVDVSSKFLDLYSRYHLDDREYELSESFTNDLSTIHHKLDEYNKQATMLGYNSLSIVVEPSGCYEKSSPMLRYKEALKCGQYIPNACTKLG